MFPGYAHEGEREGGEREDEVKESDLENARGGRDFKHNGTKFMNAFKALTPG